jgi:putative transposase
MAIHGREQKRDIRFKVANVIASTTKKLNAVVILEKLPKRCPTNMIKGVKVPSLKHRIPQAGFRGMVKRLKGSALKEAFQSERLILKAPLRSVRSADLS